MRKRKRDGYVFRAQPAQDLSEDLFEFDIYDRFNGKIDNFEFIAVLLKSTLSTEDQYQAHLKASMVLKQYSEDDYDRIRDLVNDIMQLEDYEYLVDVIRNTIGDGVFKYPSIDIRNDRLVVKV